MRFVGTPGVLEIFVTIEREIAQIESSVQLNSQTTAAAKAESEDERIFNCINFCPLTSLVFNDEPLLSIGFICDNIVCLD